MSRGGTRIWTRAAQLHISRCSEPPPPCWPPPWACCVLRLVLECHHHSHAGSPLLSCNLLCLSWGLPNPLRLRTCRLFLVIWESLAISEEALRTTGPPLAPCRRGAAFRTPCLAELHLAVSPTYSTELRAELRAGQLLPLRSPRRGLARPEARGSQKDTLLSSRGHCSRLEEGLLFCVLTDFPFEL